MALSMPIVKFSPFEALLIGEKNKVLKRQPMKNTIFITRINHQNKTVNLRELFDLDKNNTKTNSKDVFFKMPQRVCDFSRGRIKCNRLNKNKTSNILYYNFKGQKIIIKNPESVKMISKKNNLKARKVKFKDKLKSSSKLNEKIVRKFHSHTMRRKCNSKDIKKFSRLKEFKTKKRKNMHLLRGKNGKFISKAEYKMQKLKEMSLKNKYLSNYLNNLYKQNTSIYNINQPDQDYEKSQMQSATGSDVHVPNNSKILNVTNNFNKIYKAYYSNDFLETFEFPKVPIIKEGMDFEKDPNLLDLIYETFPKKIIFGCRDYCNDFSEALHFSEMLSSTKSLKIYERKRNSFNNSEKLAVIFNDHIPYIKFRRLEDIKSSVPNIKNGFSSSIDEPYTNKSHLITAKSFGRFFFRSAEGKDVFIGNLMKPFLFNSWFGSLPEL